MKLSDPHSCRIRRPVRQAQAFTLIEAVGSTWLMVNVILLGLFAVHLMGLREEKLLESKAGASDSARRNITQLKNDIYGAKGWMLGTWNGSSFTAVSNSGVAQQGSAMIIYPVVLSSNQAVDMSQFIVYYFDSNNVANQDGHLCYYCSTNGSSRIVVSNLLPPLSFTAEDCYGMTKSNMVYKNVIHTTFQYAQFQYPLTQVGSNSIFDYYRIDVRATPHLPDGP